MKYLIVFFISSISSLLALNVKVNSPSAILMNADTGAILFERNAYEKAYPASTTKIATAIYALKEMGDHLDELVLCPSTCLVKTSMRIKQAHNFQDPPYWLEPDGTHYGIKRGEILPFRSLLYGLLLKSGNDAANVIAHHVSGNIMTFVQSLNEYLKEIGCNDTHFYNPHGLFHPEHVTTPYDLAIMAREALKSPLIRKIVKTFEYERPKTNMQEAMKVKNSNRLINRHSKFYYPKAIGLKIGYISASGPTIVAVAEDKGRTLIAVILKGKNNQQRYRDAINLFEAAFAEEKVKRYLFKKGENQFTKKIKGGKVPLNAVLSEDVAIKYYPSEEPEIKTLLNWDAVTLPLKKDAKVGELCISSKNGIELVITSLHSTADLNPTFLFATIDLLKKNIYLRNILIVVFLSLVGRLLFIFIKKVSSS